MDLEADALQHDPTFHTACQKILDTVVKHKNRLTHIRPPKEGLKHSYEEMLKAFNAYRGNDLFYPYIGSGIGNGALVELSDGSIKYDFITGIGVHFGHSHPSLIASSLQASIEDIVMQGHLIQNRISFELTELLVKNAGMDHTLLTTSGAMANENALKLILQKKAPAHRILAFERCFMGRTLALAGITDKAAFREGLPHLLHVDYVPFYDWRDPMGSTEKALDVLTKLLRRYPAQHACMCFEMIQGEGGYYPGKHDFFVKLMQKLKEHGIAVFIDEVQTFGRTDRLFAFQSFGVQEYVDVVTVGKLLQTCVTLFNKEWAPKPGLISQTYTAATSSLHAAKTIILSLLNEGYLGLNGRNMQIRKRFVDHLQRLSERYPESIEGPFGHGLMIAFTPFKGNRDKALAYAKALFKAGVIVFVAGEGPTRIRFLIPAGGVTNEVIDHVAALLEEVLLQC